MTLTLHLFVLKNLVRLNNNKIRGKIPSQIGDISSLRSIWLGFNDLTGPLPQEIGNIKSLEWFVADNNYFSGTIPDMLENLSELKVFQLSMNQLTGTIPSSIWKHEKYHALLLKGNDLYGSVPDSFCSKADHIQLDDSLWFLNKPKVRCDCCEKSNCFVWDTAETIAKGTLSPQCPIGNTHTIFFFERYWIEDHISNTVVHELQGQNHFFSTEVCLSPVGCYSLYDGEKVALDYDLNYSNTYKTIKQYSACDDVDICGVSFGANHPKRRGLNHLTQLAIPDLSKLSNPSSSEYKALCWIMTEDTLFHDFSTCDGTLLQRYVLAFFYFTQKNVLLNFDELSSNKTCEWPGIMCDNNNQYVEEIYIPNSNVTGTLITEIGLLTRLKNIDMSENELTGTIDASMFAQMPYLEVVHLGGNRIGGQIPTALFELPQLKNVNISHNLFTGILPTGFMYSENLGEWSYRFLVAYIIKTSV